MARHVSKVLDFLASPADVKSALHDSTHQTFELLNSTHSSQDGVRHKVIKLDGDTHDFRNVHAITIGGKVPDKRDAQAGDGRCYLPIERRVR